ncbi:leucyl/phenylalanyl-tRNA--protein transferase [Pacificimonas sp. WHA3]|uniref:Leucyl/phenylalanyl-tRNA--protein transferase n=1 Tax=Pacificimonas pallii TaxID=2827236 RepID=A0ABS6SGL0_9SPHN|nr:leucyl/phenylalanyl-tRNA--protein transferase [Pacificimonas pallii]MBV7257547.1 leucyl/phenylalanyl-tRNA--protein transferase [Pacificimonas pallii]
MTGRLTPNVLLSAYASGVFPMAESERDRDIFWVDPKERGILPLDQFHFPRSAVKLLRQERFEHRVDSAFHDVVAACADRRGGTWINDEIRDAYSALHDGGHAHSIECWQQGKLVGGLYGVRLQGAFFGESMFTRVTGASKVALAHLVARMRMGGFQLLDTQFLTDHLAQFGAIEIPRALYRQRLRLALGAPADFGYFTRMVSGPVSGQSILQALTQTS